MIIVSRRCLSSSLVFVVIVLSSLVFVDVLRGYCLTSMFVVVGFRSCLSSLLFVVICRRCLSS